VENMCLKELELHLMLLQYLPAFGASESIAAADVAAAKVSEV